MSLSIGLCCTINHIIIKKTGSVCLCRKIKCGLLSNNACLEVTVALIAATCSSSINMNYIPTSCTPTDWDPSTFIFKYLHVVVCTVTPICFSLRE